MEIEVRADGAHISGYVNVTKRESRPVITPKGKVIEVIEQRAFEQALERAGNINVTVDHDSTHVYASTEDGTLTLYEDNIGLHADTLITDPTIIDLAKQGKIKGWSFGMYNVVDEVEARADQYPLRTIKSLDMDHITLVVNKNPVYSATSVEIRADSEIDVEERAIDSAVTVNIADVEKPQYDNSAYIDRLNTLKSRR